MATDKQIAANRANSKRSTGPKTAAGRLKSSRNAYRHGLACSLRLDAASTVKAATMARILTGERADEMELLAATEVAQAQLELLQIRALRAQIMSEVDLVACDPKKLARLAALDRYERFAHTRRRRASYKLGTP